MLIERAGFLTSLEGLLGEALDGSGRLVFLGGEAGIGKTTLAAALADAAAGPEVRRGSCDHVTTAEALGPILDAFPELIAAVDDEAAVSRLRLFRKVRDALSGSPMLLLLEDVQWADEATLDILRFLGRRLAGIRLMILATFRSEEVGRDHPLTVVLGDLAGLPGVVRMQLPALSVTGVRQLLDEAGSALDAGLVFQRTGGNPFYVTEVLAAGAEQVPATVRDAVLARVSRLSSAGQEIAAAASVLGRPPRRASSPRCRNSRSPRSMSAWIAACWSRTVTRWDSGTTSRGWRSSGRCPRLSVPGPTPGRTRS